MGLDVYLYHCKDRASAKAAEDLVEARSNQIWEEVFGPGDGYKKLPESTRQAMSDDYRKRIKEFADAHGCTGEHEQHESVTEIQVDSTIDKDHLFKIGYFRSSYNEGGIERILRNAGVSTLHDIFPGNDEYEFVPDWAESLVVAQRAIDEYGKFLSSPGGDLAVTVVSSYREQEAPNNEQEALEITKKTILAEHGFDFFSDARGLFSITGFNVVSVIPGKSFNSSCTYVVYRNKKTDIEDWYLTALRIVKETIEWVLAHQDPQNYYLRWSS